MITKLVGVRIKELRNELGESQVAFSSRIGMARTYFAEVESGKRNVSMRNFMKIVNGLGVTLEEFFDSELFDQLYPERADFDTSQPTAVLYASLKLPPKK